MLPFPSLGNLPDPGIEPGSLALHRGVASCDPFASILPVYLREKMLSVQKYLLLSFAHAPCLPHFKEGNERQWGGIDFYLLEAQVGQGVEGQETGVRCCSAF